ncbi:hypothetical protein BGZ93_003454 [Podila epicladia]|nr:hypothetical protein BGZ93_003454 [Podila epicladia]
MLLSILSIAALLAVAGAQPQNVTPRTSRAITIIDSDIYLYGDLYSLHLDPTDGWTAGNAPWNSVKLELDNALALSQTSYAAPSADGKNLFFYGQTLCPNQLAKDSSAPHTFAASSGSVTVQREKGQWTQTGVAVDVLGPRLVKADEPVPVQVLDPVNHVIYTFVYDANNPQLGMQLWTFSADHPSANIAQSKNTTMPTTQPTAPPPPLPPPPPTNSTNTTEPVPPPPVPVVPPPITLAPFIDVGAAVYLNGTIVVVGGGRMTGLLLTGDDVDAASGYYKMDRCWVYSIAANTWSVQNLTSSSGSLPLPRRLAALLVVGSKIYMHGGNTTQTIPTESYSGEFWTLDTSTWQWAQGASSPSGRAQHTLVSFNSQLLTISGVNRKRIKPFVASTAIKPDSAEAVAEAASAAAAGRLSGVTLTPTGQRDNYGRLDSQIDLSELPRASESIVYGMPHQKQFQNQHSLQNQDSYQYQYNFNPYAPVNQQQQVPLMHANAMEQPEDLQAYTDDDGLIESDGHHPSRPSSGQGVRYPGQTREGSGADLAHGTPNRTVSPRDLDGFP